MIYKIAAWFTSKRCLYIVCFFVFGLALPIPEKWNIVLDAKGGTIDDYIWYFSFYATLTILLWVAYINSLLFGFYVLFLLSIGKLIDQVFNPYDLHLPEILWVAGIAFYAIVYAKKKYGKIEQK